MTVYFANAGLIDLDVIRVMGVSVKTGTNPIGYFGTGLKFALSTLLRTGHRVELRRGREVIPVTAQAATVRGKEVQRVFLGEEALPFTTDLGRNWEVWQAYRELHSNTLDEAGEITDQEVEADTVIAVEGDAIQREFINRGATFLSSKPIAANEFLEVHPGSTRHVFYRGVRAGTLPEELMFSYNLLCPMTLTEDRTFESQFTVQWKLSQLIPRIAHRGIHAQLLAEGKRWDQQLDFTICGTPSQEFLDAAAATYTNMTSNHAARRVVDRDIQQRGVFPPARLSEEAQQTFLQAFPHLFRLGASLSPEDVEVVESLGPGVMGLWHQERGQVFLAASTLDCGLETVVATLYEEWLHKAHGYQDESRALQTFLFQKLVAVSMGLPEPEPARPVDDMPF
jgi:hypothetical protein